MTRACSSGFSQTHRKGSPAMRTLTSIAFQWPQEPREQQKGNYRQVYGRRPAADAISAILGGDWTSTPLREKAGLEFRAKESVEPSAISSYSIAAFANANFAEPAECGSHPEPRASRSFHLSVPHENSGDANLSASTQVEGGLVLRSLTLASFIANPRAQVVYWPLPPVLKLCGSPKLEARTCRSPVKNRTYERFTGMSNANVIVDACLCLGHMLLSPKGLSASHYLPGVRHSTTLAKLLTAMPVHPKHPLAWTWSAAGANHALSAGDRVCVQRNESTRSNNARYTQYFSCCQAEPRPPP